MIVWNLGLLGVRPCGFGLHAGPCFACLMRVRAELLGGAS